MKNTKQNWYYNCKAYRKAKRIREFKRWTTYIIVSYAFFSSVIAYNSYTGLINDITSQHANYKPINEAQAQELPKEEISVEQQIRDIAKQANFKYTDYLVRLAYCESIKICGEKSETCKNDTGNYPVGSIDRGVFMINDYWHKEVKDECAYNLECATKWTMDRINKGEQHEWACDKLIKNK